jgi:hypothetical protein
MALETAARELKNTGSHKSFMLKNEWGEYDVSICKTDIKDKFLASYEPRDRSGLHESYSCYIRRRILPHKPSHKAPDMPENVLRALRASSSRRKLSMPGDSFVFSPKNKTAKKNLSSVFTTRNSNTSSYDDSVRDWKRFIVGRKRSTSPKVATRKIRKE